MAVRGLRHGEVERRARHAGLASSGPEAAATWKRGARKRIRRKETSTCSV